jgi:hypothetical protein
MTFAALMNASEDRIHDTKWRFTPNASARNSVPGPHAAVGVRRRLERADHGRPDCDDAAVF